MVVSGHSSLKIYFGSQSFSQVNPKNVKVSVCVPVFSFVLEV